LRKYYREGIMDFWEKVKNDIQKGIKDGAAIVRQGVTVVREKAEELTDEGRKRLKLLDLKMKVQREVSELGGKIYDLSSKVKNPMLDKKVKAVISRIKKLEIQIAKLEDRAKGTLKKKTPKSKAKSKKKS
jgi:hypothetical protein